MEFTLNKQSKPALLILDLQELFTAENGPFENKLSAPVIEHVNFLADQCHARQIPIFCSRYLLQDDLSDAGLLAENPLVKDGLFCASSASMELDHRLQLPESCVHISRGRPGAFWGGLLLKAMKKANIDTLLLCGLSINNAISTTAREAFAYDIPAIIIKECSGAAPWENDIDSYFEILHSWTAEVTSIEDILTRLQS